MASSGSVKTLRPLVPLLSALITWGIDKEMDARCEDGLGLVRANPGAVGIGLRGSVARAGRRVDAHINADNGPARPCRADGSVAVSEEDDPLRMWKTSPAHTGFRSLAIISLLQMYLSVDSERSASLVLLSPLLADEVAAAL